MYTKIVQIILYLSIFQQLQNFCHQINNAIINDSFKKYEYFTNTFITNIENLIFENDQTVLE